MGASTKQTQTLFRLPEFRAEDVTDPELFARKMNEMRRQLEIASLTLNSINDVLTQDVADKDFLTYNTDNKRWINLPMTQAFDINGLTEEATIDPLADYTAIYDASAASVRKALIYTLLKPRGALVRLSANESIPNDVTTDIPWDLAVWDTDNVWDAANPTLLTVPSWATWARLHLNVLWLTNSSGTIRQISSTYNSSGDFSGKLFCRQAPMSVANFVDGASAWVQVQGGDVFTLAANQDSGGALSIDSREHTWGMIEFR